MTRYELTKLMLTKLNMQISEIMANMPDELPEDLAWNCYCNAANTSNYVNEMHTILALPNMMAVFTTEEMAS